MTWDTAVLFDAFADEGMLERATVTPSSGGTPYSLAVGVQRPDTLELSDQFTTAETSIEYETAAAPVLAEGDGVQLRGSTYRVRQPPMKAGDGTYSRAWLNTLGRAGASR